MGSANLLSPFRRRQFLAVASGAAGTAVLGRSGLGAQAATARDTPKPLPVKQMEQVLGASGTISNGILHSDDLSAASPLFRVGGAGDINLVDETINYTAKPTIVETSKGQGGKELSQLNGVTIPIRLTGSLWKPKYKVDISDAVREKARQKIEEKLADPEVKQKINDKLGELLFGKKKKKDQPAEQPAEQPAQQPTESQPSNQ